MNTTKVSPTKRNEKIPVVKHFYDANAAKKAKKLAKKVMKSRLMKSATSAKSSRGRKSKALGSETASAAVRIGTFAALAAGGYALWKNREKIQKLVNRVMEPESSLVSDSTYN